MVSMRDSGGAERPLTGANTDHRRSERRERPDLIPPEPLLTTGEVARVLSISVQTVRNWVASGRLDAVSFAVMRRRHIAEAFAFDRHFLIAGFTLIPTAA